MDLMGTSNSGQQTDQPTDKPTTRSSLPDFQNEKNGHISAQKSKMKKNKDSLFSSTLKVGEN